MADSYLDKSGYPIKDPNMELDLPNPNPEPKITGVDVNVSSSQAPAPDTQKVNVTPDIEPETKNPFSLLEQSKKDENLATLAGLKDMQNLVKFIHAKRFGEEIPPETQDVMANAIDDILINRVNRGQRLATDLMKNQDFYTDYSGAKVEADNTFVSTGANYINDFKQNAKTSLSVRGYNVNSDREMIDALSIEFDKNKNFFIGDSAMNIPNVKLFGDARWLEGTVWEKVFDSDTRELYTKIITDVNKHIAESDLSDEEGKEIFMNYAKAVLTLDEGAFSSAVTDIEMKTGTNMSAIISDTPLIDGVERAVSSLLPPSFIDSYPDISWSESDNLDQMRRANEGFRNVDWNSSVGAEIDNVLLNFANGDKEKALRYKEYLMDDDLNYWMHSMGVWHATRDVVRHFTSADGFLMLGALAGAEPLFKAAFRVTAPLWAAAVAEPTHFGEVGAAVATTGVFVGMGAHAMYSSVYNGIDKGSLYMDGEISGSQHTYEQTMNTIGFAIGGLMTKHGIQKPIKHSTFKSSDGQTYTIPTSETAWNYVSRSLKPNHRLKAPALISENVNNYIHKINAKHYKDFAEFETAFIKDVNVPSKLKEPGVAKKIYENAEIMYYQGHGWTEEAIPQIEKSTLKKMDNVTYTVVKPSKNLPENIIKEVVSEKKVELKKLETELKGYNKIELEGTGESGVKGLSSSFKNKTNIKKTKEAIDKIKTELDELSIERKGEIAANKQKKELNKNEGDLIIWSDYKTNIRDWAYIRISRKDGKIYEGQLPEKVVPGKTELNYYSGKNDRVPGIKKETPVENSMKEVYIGKKLNKSGHGALNGLLEMESIRPKWGDRAGKNNEYFYTGNQFGWRNIYDEVGSGGTVGQWYQKLDRMDKTLFETGRIKDYFNGFKRYVSKFGKDDLPARPGKGKGRFEQPVGAGKIYTHPPNQKLFEVSEQIKLENLKNGRVIDDNYITIDGTTEKPWFDKAQKSMAEAFEKGEHRPDYAPMAQSYEALMRELPDAWNILKKNGFEVELWTKKGEPYKNSAEMHKDMSNGHLYIRQSTNGFGPVENMTNMTVNEFIKAQGLPEKFMASGKKGQAPVLNAKGEFHPAITEVFPMLKQSKVKLGKTFLSYNDLFRAIHDFTHHGKSGNGFGPKGEFQGFIDGLSIFTEAAHPALFSEVSMQNAYFNTFGKYAPQKMVWAPTVLNKIKSKIIKPKDSGVMVENTSPMSSRKIFETFMKESDRFNFESNGGKWGVIANEITDIKGIDFVLRKLGNKDVKFNGYSLKEHLNKLKTLKPEEIIEVNNKFINDFIRTAEKEGRVIHRANTKGFYEGKQESGTFLTGDITATELQTIGNFLGQKSILSNHGEIFSYSPQINNLKFTTSKNKLRGDNYTEIYTQDGHVAYLVGKATKDPNNVTSVVEHTNRFGEFDATNTNHFTSPADIAAWREMYGPKGNLSIDPIPQEVNLAARNRAALEKTALEDGYLTIDWANINDPANVEIMRKMYQNNNKMEFRYFDETTGKMIETKVEYAVDTRIPIEQDAYRTYMKDKVGELTWKDRERLNIDDQAIIDGYNKKIVEIKEIPVVEGEPVKRNPGLTKNHMGNINLSKFPADKRKTLRNFIDEIGEPQFTELFRTYVGHEQMVSMALEPKNLESILNRSLINGFKEGAYRKDGGINETVRTNPSDIIGAQFLLKSSIDKYMVTQDAALIPIIKKLIGANQAYRANAGRTLNSMKVEIDGQFVEFDNLNLLSKDEASAYYAMFSKEQDPATLMQQLVEFRRNNLLSAVSSLTRSFVGNYSHLGLQFPNKIISGALNEALTYFDYGIRGKEWKPLENRTMMDVIHFTEGFLKTRGVPNLLKDIALGRESAIAESALAKNEGWFTTPRIPGKLGVIFTTPQRGQIFLDAMVRKPAENGFIYEFAHRIAKSEKLHGREYKMRVDELIKNPDANMVRMAKSSSEYITFQQQLGTWGKMFNRIRTGKGTEAVQMVVPFFNTSANLMKISYNMTPLGVFTPKYFKAAKEGFSKGEWGKFSDQTARMSVGTSIMYWMGQSLGGQYHYEGNWADEDKAVRELKTELGMQPNSIWWENKDGEIESFSLLGFEPMSSILNVSATWKENKDEEFQEKTAAVLYAFIQSYKENPFMQGTDDLMDLIEGLSTGGERGKDPVNYFTKMFLGSTIPNIIMQSGKIKDDIRYENPYRENWRVDELDNWYNSLLTEFRYISNESAVPKVNLFGNPVRVVDPKGALMALRVSKGDKGSSYDAVASEIIRLAPKLGDLSFELKNYKSFLQLTPKQRFLLEVSAGRQLFETLENKMTGGYEVDEYGVAKIENGRFVEYKGDKLSDAWKSKSDLNKIKTIKEIKSYIKKSQLFSIAPELFKKGEEGDWKMVDPKDKVVYKEDDKDKGFAEVDEIREELTKKYRESEKGSLEIEKAEKYANEIIVLMRRGMDKGEAIDNVLKKIKE